MLLKLDSKAQTNLDLILNAIKVLKQAGLEDSYDTDYHYHVNTYIGKHLKELGSGCSRYGYILSDLWVLKFGCEDHNRAEARTYKRKPTNKAACFLVKGHPELLIMRRVNPISERTVIDRLMHKHKWIQKLDDWYQVGYVRGYKKKILVCYDYAGPDGTGEKI